MRVIAIDWSGRRHGEARSIWLAEARDDATLVRLECGRTREQVRDHLVELASRGDEMVVGIDCSFSLPGWFLREHDYASARALWDAAAQDGERWLMRCEPPFWGRAGKPKPARTEHFRVTESAAASIGGIRPKSTFQVGGAGSVGSGSVRAFPILAALQDAGFAIWPFDPSGARTIVEVWPRACTGPVVKSSAEARRAYVDARYPALSPVFRDTTITSDDAFDAAVTAMVMAEHTDELRALAAPRDDAAHLEGWVWSPPNG
ncbi:MAG TPA: DUF429 domain-containing protein [Acidimicrobiia bacterium]